LGTRRRIPFCVAILASLMLTLGCGKKATDQPESHPQSAAASSASSNYSSPWRMELKVSPDHPSMTKPITLQLHIVDERGQPVSDAQVNGSLTMKLMDMGTTALKFSPKGNGDYEASLKSVDMSGPWGLAVDAVQGSTHAKQSFEVIVFD
jgi:hypothetical protein